MNRIWKYSKKKKKQKIINFTANKHFRVVGKYYCALQSKYFDWQNNFANIFGHDIWQYFSKSNKLLLKSVTYEAYQLMFPLFDIWANCNHDNALKWKCAPKGNDKLKFSRLWTIKFCSFYTN